MRASSVRDYEVTLVGVEQFDGSDVYHLRLHAYRDRNEHPLTDLLVDRRTFRVREARGEAAEHFVIGSGRAAGVIGFRPVGTYWLVTREHFEAAANAMLIHVRVQADIEAENIAPPADLAGVAWPTPAPSPSPH